MYLKPSLCLKCQAETGIGLQESRPPNHFPPIEENQLSSSYMPTDSEVSQIIPVIHEMQKDVDRLSKLISELQSHKDDVQRNLDHCRAVVSPVRRVPVEILTEIFSLCTYEDNYLRVDLDKIHAPALVLSQTCSTWRRVATSLPKLWSRLSLNLACDREGISDLVQLHLHHSARFPLEIDTFAHLGRFTEDDFWGHYAANLRRNGWSVFRLLLKAYKQWSGVRFDFHRLIYEDGRFYRYANDLSNWDSGHFANLHSLSFSWAGDHPDPTNPLFRMLVMRPSPMLHSLCLREYYPSTMVLLSSLRPQKITLMGICYNSDLNHVFDIFGESLEDVVLNAQGFEQDTLLMTENNQLQSLEISIASDAAPYSASIALSCLTLPSLTTLDLSVCDCEQYHLEEPLGKFIKRSSCSLQDLRLAGDLFVSDLSLVEALALMPTVTHFTLDALTGYGLYLTQDFFQRLLPNQSRIIFPRLKTFRLVFKQEETNRRPLPEPCLILSMINSRRSNFISSLDANDCRQLQLFGLSVRLLPTAVAREWASTITSLFRPLQRDGLHLEWDIRFLTPGN
ncbi:hypothetical protein VKT23_000555 [Stygiomarasmius scandens]|uniref:F-box domain-containing protein n=1 Tax=Marasmiellus scandens TaxID=2682957 RepID=A0ABR1K4E9_9AGAR